MIDTWNDTCAYCKRDLPLDAPAHQKYCSAECRETAYETRMLQHRQEKYLARRKARLAVKQDRGPCEECGAPIPVEAIRSKRFCCDPCQRRNYDRRKAAEKREQRLAMREKARQARKAAG